MNPETARIKCLRNIEKIEQLDYVNADIDGNDLQWTIIKTIGESTRATSEMYEELARCHAEYIKTKIAFLIVKTLRLISEYNVPDTDKLYYRLKMISLFP